MANDDIPSGGLLGNPLASALLGFGGGLLSAAGPSTTPVSFGQALSSGLRGALAAQQAFTQNQLLRSRLADDARQRRLGRQISEAVTAAGGSPLLGLLAETDPEAALRIIAPTPTTLEREFSFLTGLGFSQQQALEALRRGTTVNVGGQTRPTRVLTPQETRALGFAPGAVVTAEVVGPDGRIDPGTLDVQQAGRQPSAAQEKRAGDVGVSLDILNRFETVVKENNIEPGFVAEGGAAMLRATPAGQVIGGLLGIDLTEAQAEALSLQEQLSNQLLAAMRGASVGPAEQARFEQQLPRLDQPPEVFRANLRNTRRNLDLLRRRLERIGAQPGTSRPTGRTETTPQRRFRVEGGELVPVE